MENQIPQINEDDLVTNLQPIRGFFLAQALYQFMEMGIQKTLSMSKEYSVNQLALQKKLNERRLLGFLQYLANEGYVIITESRKIKLTSKGEKIVEFYPWYKLLIGGYAKSFQQLAPALSVNGFYASRDSLNVGIGSCGISQHDALPMTRRLLDRVSIKLNTIVDLGCGDGSYLIDLCKSFPEIHALGLDPDQDTVKVAMVEAKAQGVANRVSIKVGDAKDLSFLSKETGPFCFITAFVLQEILEQSGRDEIIVMLKRIINIYPDSYWIVIEVDHRPEDSSVMSSGLGLAYYNPYYLIHNITEQRLEKLEFWNLLFQEVGLKVISIEHPDPVYDSLGLKVGFLLSKEEKPI